VQVLVTFLDMTLTSIVKGRPERAVAPAEAADKSVADSGKGAQDAYSNDNALRTVHFISYGSARSPNQ